MLDGEAEACLVQLACSQAPDGCEEWSMQLLTTDKLIEMDSIGEKSGFCLHQLKQFITIPDCIQYVFKNP